MYTSIIIYSGRDYPVPGTYPTLTICIEQLIYVFNILVLEKQSRLWDEELEPATTWGCIRDYLDAIEDAKVYLYVQDPGWRNGIRLTWKDVEEILEQEAQEPLT